MGEIGGVSDGERTVPVAGFRLGGVSELAMKII